MTDLLTIPQDLTDAERRAVEALRAQAVEEAEREAAVVIYVRRAYEELRPRYGRDGAFGVIAERLTRAGFPCQPATVERIRYGKGRWGVAA